nr:PspC domain-containing protein [Saprospiraceae bacterium]
MNKTTNINLGGFPFTIDEDAYKQLRDYLGELERHFGASEGYEEIMDDIENRMAELLQDQLTARRIVTKAQVEKAVQIMGMPEDIIREGMEEPERHYKTGKKLFRDTDDKIIGGVCSGLAAYFGIPDPLWVRVGFAIMFFGLGSGVVLYIILWALVPEALTPKDFLAMRGEPINVNN